MRRRSPRSRIAPRALIPVFRAIVKINVFRFNKGSPSVHNTHIVLGRHIGYICGQRGAIPD